MIEEAASAIGAPLLDAESLEDFSRRLDASVENKGLAAHFNQLARVLSVDGALAEQFERVDEAAIVVFGCGRQLDSLGVYETVPSPSSEASSLDLYKRQRTSTRTASYAFGCRP